MSSNPPEEKPTERNGASKKRGRSLVAATKAALSKAGGAAKRNPLRATVAIGVVVAGLVGLAAMTVFRDDDSVDDSVREQDELPNAVGSAIRMLGFVEPHYAIAHPTGSRVELRASPDGPIIERLGPRTEFGSPRTFSVAETRGEWIGVVVPELPNGKLGWLRRDSGEVDLSDTSYSIHVDLSGRFLELRYGNDVLRRATVSIGRAGHSTPVGRFSVTDALAGRDLGPWYGCCALATSGHQSSLPPGWVGGDRIAIHGSPGPVGGAVSTGCIRTTNLDMVALFADVPLGAPVLISG